MLIPSTGGTAQNLTNDPSSDTEPAFSPDGSMIAFVSERSGSQDIWPHGRRRLEPRRPDRRRSLREHRPGLVARRLEDRLHQHGRRHRGTSTWWTRPGRTPKTSRTIRRVTRPNPCSLPIRAFASTTPATVTARTRSTRPTCPGPCRSTCRRTSPRTRGGLGAGLAAPGPLCAVGSPIQHVIIIYQENHSFDETLGKLCAIDARCDSVSSGQISAGQTIPLQPAPDIVPRVAHGAPAQLSGIDGGLMNGFDLIPGCEQIKNYACYEQYDPSQIPNLAALAGRSRSGSHLRIGPSRKLGLAPGSRLHIRGRVLRHRTTTSIPDRDGMRQRRRRPLAGHAHEPLGSLPDLYPTPGRVRTLRALAGALGADDHGPVRSGRVDLASVRAALDAEGLRVVDLPHLRRLPLHLTDSELGRQLRLR